MFIILAAVLPAAVLTYYIFRKDPVKEPAALLLRGFAYGIAAAIVSIAFSTTLASMGLVDLSMEKADSLASSLQLAFFGAAIPEELAKLFMLWLLLRRNRYFDEYFDGVVYAVSIGMGFAAIENVAYLYQNIDQWMSVAVMRGLFSVPGHFAFAILMGYFYSLVHIGGKNTHRDRLMVIVAPILAHGAFDALLFASELSNLASSLLTVVFLLLCWRLVIICKLHIHTLCVFDNTPKNT